MMNEMNNTKFVKYNECPVLARLVRQHEITTNVDVDDFSRAIASKYDIAFDGVLRHAPYALPDVVRELNASCGYRILAIIGASGRGKSTLLREFETTHKYATRELSNDVALISNFASFGRDNAIARLSGTGLMSIPTWTRPASVLSVGERFRADMSFNIDSNTIFDEFTSTVDRNVAKSCCNSLNKYVHRNNLHGVVVSTCHKDFIEYLRPDIVIDLDDECIYDCRNATLGCEITMRIVRSNNRASWQRLFKHHHYLTQDINKACRFYEIYWDDVLVGCRATLPFPSVARHIYRGHRLVVLPDFQGLGIGTRSLIAMGEYYLRTGGKTLSTRTSSIALYNALSKNALFEMTNADNSAEKTRQELCDETKTQAKIERLRAAGKTESEINTIMSFKAGGRDKKCYTFMYRGATFANGGRYYIAIPDDITLNDEHYRAIEREIVAHRDKYVTLMYGQAGNFTVDERLEAMLVRHGIVHTYYRSLRGGVSTIISKSSKQNNVSILRANATFHDDDTKTNDVVKTKQTKRVVERAKRELTRDEKFDAIVDALIDIRVDGALRYIDDVDDDALIANIKKLLCVVLRDERVIKRYNERQRK